MEQGHHPRQPTQADTEVGQEEKSGIAQLLVEPDVASAPASKIPTDLSLKQLINKLNLLNFQGLPLSIVFKHRASRRTVTIPAHPLPCQDAQLECHWQPQADIEQIGEALEFQCLYVPRGQQLYEVNARIKDFDDQQISFTLPQISREISERRIYRHPCRDVAVYLFQNSGTYYGQLIDFNAFQFRVSIYTVPPQTFRWIDQDQSVTVVFTKGQTTLFSGECRIIRQTEQKNQCQLILTPVKQHIRRFAPREFRNIRYKLVPSPDAVFQHPLFGSSVSLRIHDISGSGFSVEEQSHAAVLLPGMIIPKLNLTLSDGDILPCMAQVIYSRRLPDTDTVRSGLVILDMTVEAHTRLLALLHQAGDANIYICKKVDMTALWDFFFETGFIYPEKYKFIEAHKEEIQNTYDKLYNRTPNIANHFIYQANGRILGHMAMVRFYDKAWLIHHHAAVRSEYQMAGIIVLNQVSQFINDSHRLAAMNMDFVYCFYRPDNKFPAHVFGGAARHINNQNICSVDQFAYYHHTKDQQQHNDLPRHWRLSAVNEDDLRDLSHRYGSLSGGLMLTCLRLDADPAQCKGLYEAYRQIGLKRERQLVALRYKEKLCAVFMANHADLGLNMSDLTNSVTIMVVDPAPLTKELLAAATDQVVDSYEPHEVPILLFPQKTAAQLTLESEKSYCLWIYNTQNLDPYFRYLKRFLKFARH